MTTSFLDSLMFVLQSIFAPLILAATLGRCASQIPLNFPDRQDKVITEELSSYIQNQLHDGNITGLSLGIVLPNGRVEFASWGNRTEEGDPATSDTIFNLGSCSKAFLSASLGILMRDFADGKNKTALPNFVREFNWQTKICDLLPEEWMIEDQWTTDKADLTDLLSHRTGLPSHDGSLSPDDSPGDVVRRMGYLRTAYELRQLYEYNNQMYITGAYIVSKYSGSYRDFVEERIFKPLGMTASTLYPDRAFETGNFTQSWAPATRRRIPFFMPEHVTDLIAGAGGVMSTAEDMTRWMKMLLNAGVDRQTNATIIPQKTFDYATSAISVAKAKGDGLISFFGYGLGWGRLTYRGHELVQHNGGAPGVATIVDLYPYDGFGIVLLANTATKLTTRNIARTIAADHILGLPPIVHQVTNEMQLTEPSSSSPLETPSPDVLSEYAGTYSNAGYGNFTLCSPLFPTSTECLDVIRDFRIVDSTAGKPTPSVDLYSAWPRFWGSHLRLSFVSGNFILRITKLYVDGYGANQTPFEDVSSEQASATFVVEEGKVVGVGLFVALSESWRAKKGGSVRDVADVWFDKL
ncbi:beta-lactamase/transpeptidase-like protein [Mycena maculata]|uniref:Beta-lactamase/transpeptidase-like protein n=1 Tax=Mycena maculata TaxID=230809 RepID=A0AAD7IIY9_9AGAR|nr:beta-lactamase/transpeptidase-like protein [Mycena maculata]